MRASLTALSPFVFLAGLLCASPALAAPSDDTAPAALKVVKLTIGDDVSEDPAQENPLGPSPLNFRGKLLQLRKLAADKDVAGLRLEVKGAPDLAHAIDLLGELRHVKEAGKPIFCYAEDLSQRDLMIASVADLLVMPSAGRVELAGLQAEVMYLKDLFAKLHISFDVLHIGNFKTAFEDFAKDAMSDEQRETIGALLDEYWNQMLDTISSNRRMERGALETLFGDVIVLPEVAQASGLIDMVGFEKDFDAQIEQRLGGKVEYVKNYGQPSAEDLEKMFGNPFAAFALIPKLLNPPKKEAPKEPYVAIVYATGMIVSGKSQAGFDGKVTAMGSDTIVEALDELCKDDNVKAVVLRVNSPGGSALASDMIWGAIQRLKAAKKPVVASMGNVAGSGGYWISVGCSAIVAQPCTITGSMGVVSMLPNLSEALKAIGVNVEVVARGPNGDQLSLLRHGPTPLLEKVLTATMQKVYEDFLTKASEGRRLDRARIEELARGRVWTGRQAESLGLVDEMGGLQDSIDLACTMAGLAPESTPLAEYPAPPNPFEQLKQMFGGEARTGGILGALASRLGLGNDLLSALAAVPQVRELLPVVEKVLSNQDPLGPDTVQCLMPISINIR